MKNKYKLIIGALALVALTLVLTGCSSNSATPSVTVTEKVTQDVQEDPAYSDEEAYLYALESAAPDFYYSYEDSDLLDLGWTICESLDAGLTIDDILYTAIDAGVDPYGVGASIGAAAATLCSNHYNEVVAWLNSNGY